MSFPFHRLAGIAAAVCLAIVCSAVLADPQASTPAALAASISRAGAPWPSTSSTKPAAKGPKVFGSLRVRPEDWTWFQPKTPGMSNNHYAFTGSLLRLGLTGDMPYGNYTLEIAESTLLSVPHDAAESKPESLGNFGPGANYFAASGNRNSSLFLKQAFATLDGSSPCDSLTLGRFEYFDGQETKPTDPSLNNLQQTRVAQRLIGNFGYSDVERSFDGIKYTHSDPGWNFTAMSVVPTVGVFTLLRDNDDIDLVKVDYAALTLPQTSVSRPQVARIFGIYYSDDRPDTVKTDNRPLAVRTADTASIRITTIGADYLRVFPESAGKFDLVLWGADQTGHWGDQTQSAYAYDGELGYQPRHMAWNPWLRGVYYVASGDNNPNDGTHGTFFPILPTPRIYARFPFYSETNLDDAFVELILRPSTRSTVRVDAHDLRLNNSNDLWYQGGGAFEPTGNFGYAGTTSSGQSSLADLYDVSLDYKISTKSTMSFYYGYAVPGAVIKALYTDHPATMGYAEWTQSI